MSVQRFESSVTAVSWIPSDAITGPAKIPFELGVTPYDEPPPDRLVDFDAFGRAIASGRRTSFAFHRGR